ncbi:YdcF family protein [Siccirubricoccus sp. KC 17139]|uniref:YdcF family protein n=1 Tax=Siccirubricoccus soli TaxID=2899147 RepID=A0ABT1D8M0_9PROT|nr:YdcF family protein [Siccirubricoccus soli]MCO6418263.1 YdcF family protein [Siccirubricoccus soli]MCP2684398.1 YdcF family protein [Siccirubricoccus soli]
MSWSALLRVRHKRRRLLALLAILPPLALLAGFAWYLRLAAAFPPAPEQETAGIAVLTGGAERVATGLRLLQQERAAKLLISGASPRTTLADLARSAGMEPAALAGRVTLGSGATSTRGNAAEIADWARAEGIGSLRVVTAAYHMPRALLELRRVLPGVLLVPHPVVPASLRDREAGGRWRTWSLLAGEYLKLLAAWAGLHRPGAAFPEPNG